MSTDPFIKSPDGENNSRVLSNVWDERRLLDLVSEDPVPEKQQPNRASVPLSVAAPTFFATGAYSSSANNLSSPERPEEGGETLGAWARRGSEEGGSRRSSAESTESRSSRPRSTKLVTFDNGRQEDASKQGEGRDDFGGGERVEDLASWLVDASPDDGAEKHTEGGGTVEGEECNDGRSDSRASSRQGRAGRGEGYRKGLRSQSVSPLPPDRTRRSASRERGYRGGSRSPEGVERPRSQLSSPIQRPILKVEASNVTRAFAVFGQEPQQEGRLDRLQIMIPRTMSIPHGEDDPDSHSAQGPFMHPSQQGRPHVSQSRGHVDGSGLSRVSSSERSGGWDRAASSNSDHRGHRQRLARGSGQDARGSGARGGQRYQHGASFRGPVRDDGREGGWGYGREPSPELWHGIPVRRFGEQSEGSVESGAFTASDKAVIEGKVGMLPLGGTLLSAIDSLPRVEQKSRTHASEGEDSEGSEAKADVTAAAIISSIAHQFDSVPSLQDNRAKLALVPDRMRLAGDDEDDDGEAGEAESREGRGGLDRCGGVRMAEETKEQTRTPGGETSADGGGEDNDQEVIDLLISQAHHSTSAASTFVYNVEEEGVDAQFVKDVTSFVHFTGGSWGQWFGDGKCFGLGIGVLDDSDDSDPDVASVSTRGNSGEEKTVGVPDGFGAGRDILPAPVPNATIAWTEFVKGSAHDLAFGRVSWGQVREPAGYVRVPLGKVSETALPHLLKYFAEQVWGLERPGLLISVAGGSIELDMRREEKKGLLHGLLQQATESRAWIVTNGVDSGISKHIGEAAMECDSKVPVIGVVPWGLVEGRQALWECEADGRLARHRIKAAVDDFGSFEQQYLYMKPRGLASAKLDRNHTHFFLIDDGREGLFGGEVAVRSDWEACLCAGAESVQQSIDEVLLEQNLGWQQLSLPSNRSSAPAPVPCVCVCVQGKSRTLAKIYQTVMAGTPVLLAKGSGKVTDLLADAVEYHDCVFGARKQQEESMQRAADTDSVSSWRSELSYFSQRPGLNEERFELMRRVFTYDPENDPWIQNDITKTYDIPKFHIAFVRVVGMVQAIAKSFLCQVYHMHDPDDDLSSSMLRCVIKKENLMGKKWKDMLDLIVEWSHVDMMKQALRHLNLVDMSCRTAMKLAFHKAFVENKQRMAQVLLDAMDCTEVYNLRKTVEQVQFSWKSLIRSHGKQGGLLKTQHSKAVIAWCDVVSKLLQTHENINTVSPALKYWSDLYDVAHANETVSLLFIRGEGASWIERLLGSKSFVSNLHSEIPPNSMERVHKFEQVYKRVLGEDWWYRTSSVSTEMDLFLWSMLMHRREMTMMIWQRLDVPVRSALLAATFYRSLSQQSDIKPHVQMNLLDRASEFEQMAVDVQTIAMRHDSSLALESMERPGRLWKGQTGVDLAVLGSCGSFVEKCCGEALDCRWSGDLHPYRQPLGLYVSVLISLLSFGLLAPRIMVYREPPRAETLRSPSQRIKIPKGYTQKRMMDHVFTESTRECNQIFSKLQKLSSDGLNGGHVDMEEIAGDGHNSSLRGITFADKYALFFAAPCTIYVMDALGHVVQSVIFTNFLRSNDPSSEITFTEKFLALCYLSTTISTLAHVGIDGLDSVVSTWTMFRALSCASFWMGFLPHLELISGWPALSAHLPSKQDAEVFYGISLFFSWVRVLHLLSVSKAIGPLVIVMRRIGRQTFIVAAVWAVLLLAFSSAYQGCGIDRQDRRQTTRMQNWESWWLLRTYFQSFGEPFFEEMVTDSANVITILMWPVMNLMLVNLLIAIMNDTYTEVKDKSRLQWMVEMFHIAKEYRTPSRLNALLLLYDLVVFARTKKDIDRRLAQLTEGTVGGWRAWFDDVRFKFRKFQSRDIPTAEAAEHQTELLEDIALVEEAEQKARRAQLDSLATRSSSATSPTARRAFMRQWGSDNSMRPARTASDERSVQTPRPRRGVPSSPTGRRPTPGDRVPPLLSEDTSELERASGDGGPRGPMKRGSTKHLLLPVRADEHTSFSTTARPPLSPVAATRRVGPQVTLRRISAADIYAMGSTLNLNHIPNTGRVSTSTGSPAPPPGPGTNLGTRPDSFLRRDDSMQDLKPDHWTFKLEEVPVVGPWAARVCRCCFWCAEAIGWGLTRGRQSSRFDRRWVSDGTLTARQLRQWKSRLNWKLQKLRMQLKQDAEAFRSSTKFLLDAKAEYLKTHWHNGPGATGRESVTASHWQGGPGLSRERSFQVGFGEGPEDIVQSPT